MNTNRLNPARIRAESLRYSRLALAATTPQEQANAIRQAQKLRHLADKLERKRK